LSDPNVVTELWQRQKVWSRVADKLKAGRSRARTGALWLGIAGALLETVVATGLVGSNCRFATAAAGAVLLAIVPVLRASFITEERARRWTRARSASEGMKSELYTFLAKASPYDGEGAVRALREECRRIDRSVSDLEGLVAGVASVTDQPPPLLVGEQYVERRALQQVTGFYDPKTREASQRSQRFRIAEVGLTVVAASVGALAAASTGGTAPWQATVGAWAAVLTTVGGAISTHAAANRYDFLVTSYSATSRRIKDLVADWRDGGAPVQGPAWSEFVKRCESAISIENESWLAKWTEPERAATK
jgi:hypothetical protein